MKSDSGISDNAATLGKPRRRRIFSLPGTRIGWWSIGLMITFTTLVVINFTVFMNLSEQVPWRQILLPFYGTGMIACGLAAAIVAAVAVVRFQER